MSLDLRLICAALVNCVDNEHINSLNSRCFERTSLSIVM